MAITPEVKAAVDNLLNDWDASGGKGGAQRVLRDFSSAANSVPANTSGATDEQRLGYALDVLKAFKEGGWAFSDKGYQGYMEKVVPLVQAYAPAQNIFPLWKSTSGMPITRYGGGPDDAYTYEEPAGVNYAQWEGIAKQLGYNGPIYGTVGYDIEGGGITGIDPQFASFVDQKRAEGYDFVQYQPDLRNYRQKYGLRLPDGQIVGEYYGEGRDADITSFFKNFLLPAAGIAFGANMLGAGASGGGANALSALDAGMGVYPSTGTIGAGGVLGLSDLASIPTSVLGEGGAAGAGGDILAGGAEAAVDPEMQRLLRQQEIAQAGGSALGGIGPGATSLPGMMISGSAAGDLVDRALNLINTPAGQAVLGAAGSVVGGVMEASAAEKAAETQSQAAQNALQLQREMFEYQKGLLEPYRTAGTKALERLSGAMGLGGPGSQQQMLEMDPGYGFRLGEGLKALERMQASRGNFLSGGALKAGQRFAQDTASQEYGNAYNRLANIAGLGQTVGGQLGNAAAGFGTSAGNIMGQEANALAAGRIGRQSAYSNAIGGALGSFENYLNRQQRQQMIDIYGRMLAGGG